MENSIGNIHIEIISAKLSRNTEIIGNMDPYVSIEYKKIKYKTKISKASGLLPMWNETLIIPIFAKDDNLLISCFDEDLISDDLIG